MKKDINAINAQNAIRFSREIYATIDFIWLWARFTAFRLEHSKLKSKKREKRE